MTAYYNEHDENAAAWLRELIKEGHIADGIVDTRSIVAVEAADLRDFDQCHFFAGIGVWSYALRLAGWADDRPVWTGSCPCQPFSAAGKREGFADERHLWPAFHRLIAECRPPTVLGEQVASKDGLAWLDTVFADLEGSGYAAAAADLCAAGVGAPHIRQRLYFVGKRLADTELHGRTPGKISGGVGAGEENRGMQQSEGCCAADWLADTLSAGRAEGRAISGDRPLASSSSTGRVEHTAQQQQHGRRDGGPSGRDEYSDAGAALRMADTSGLQPQQFEGERTGSDEAERGRPSGELAGRGDAGGLGHHHHPGLEGQRGGHPPAGGRLGAVRPAAEAGEPRGLADAEHDDGRADVEGRRPDRRAADGGSGAALRMADARGEGRREVTGSASRDEAADGREGRHGSEPDADHVAASHGKDRRPGPVNGHWRAADWLYCRDGKWRPVEPGTFPLAHGSPARVGRLRGYGNALNAQTAQAFIEAVM